MRVLNRLRTARALPRCPDMDNIVARAAPSPRVLWIELTSRCPFDCVFCSRKLLRGAGQHMDFELFRKLIAALHAPEVIRLNYAGESAHYPRLVEACELAAGTGASVELVTALASLPAHRVDALAASGVQRITVSLHALDPERFRAIYGFSDVDAMRWRIERLMHSQASRSGRLTVDLAFVAMQRNLMELPAVAAYAAELGVRRLAVHPVIRRDPIAERFEQELDADRLRPAFLDALRTAIEACSAAHPALAFESSTPEVAACVAPAGPVPSHHPAPLANGLNVHGCEQDPFDTVHVLADGSVVSCEQRDGIVLGRLDESTLAEIWHGSAYAQFRRAHAHADDAHCRACPYKLVSSEPTVLPAAFRAGIGGYDALLDGWFREAGGGIAWGRTSAGLRLRGGARGLLRLQGMLPPGSGSPNSLAIEANGVLVGVVSNPDQALRPVSFSQVLAPGGPLHLRLGVSQSFTPQARGAGADARALGFGLLLASFDAA